MARTQQENIRERILDAAEKRLWRYGFKKTTIDEIAADAGVGKGTVYLHFDSKEDISLAIFAEYKVRTMQEQEQIARDLNLDTLTKIRRYLAHPILNAYHKYQEFPEALEIVVALKPHIIQRMRPYQEEEIAVLATILEEGNRRGVLSVPDTLQAARSLKMMTMGFMPPYPCVRDESQIEREIDAMVQMAYLGLKKT